MENIGEILQRIVPATSKDATDTTSDIESAPPPACPVCHGVGYLRRDVPVGHPDFGTIVPCECRLTEIRGQREEQLRRLSNLGPLASKTFDNFRSEGSHLTADVRESLNMALEQAKRYAEKPTGWLLLTGGYGCGKTHLAAAIANHAVAHGRPVLFVVVPDLLDHLRAAYGPNSAVTYDERFDQLRDAPLLILDDLGTQSSSRWAQEKLYQLFNHRYNSELPTVVTTNVPLEEIDPRLRSRLMDAGLSRIITIQAPDYRQLISGSPVSPSRFGAIATMTFDTFSLREDELDPEDVASLKRVAAACKAFARKPDGWLVLLGGYNTGKSHLAGAIAQAVPSESGSSALYISVPELLDYLRAAFSPDSDVSYDERFQEVRAVPLLILDDLGSHSGTPWANEKLEQLLTYRYSLRLPTVITSSLALDEIAPRLRAKMLDERLCRVYSLLVPPYTGGNRSAGGAGGTRRRTGRTPR